MNVRSCCSWCLRGVTVVGESSAWSSSKCYLSHVVQTACAVWLVFWLLFLFLSMVSILLLVLTLLGLIKLYRLFRLFIKSFRLFNLFKLSTLFKLFSWLLFTSIQSILLLIFLFNHIFDFLELISACFPSSHWIQSRNWFRMCVCVFSC